MKYLKRLCGGRRNVVELFESGSEKIVVKTNLRSDHFDYYSCEKNTLQLLKGLNLCPRLIDYDDDSKKLVMTFIEGHTISERTEYKMLGKRLFELHNISIDTSSAFSFYRDINRDLGDIIKIYEKLRIPMSAITQKELTKVFFNAPETTSNIHGSLIPSNIIVADVPYFIDFEMASKNNRSLDIAYLSAFIPENCIDELIVGYSEASGIDKDQLYDEFNYGRYHICALTLGLFLQKMSDAELMRRSISLKN